MYQRTVCRGLKNNSYFSFRFDEMAEKTADTKKAVDALWKSYQYTDELAPLMEWIEENITKSTREINTNSASQTEDLQEKQEKVLDQLDKKRKVYTDNKAKGEKLLTDPKAPKFLQGHLDKLNEMWKEANNAAENRLKQLKGKNFLTDISYPYARYIVYFLFAHN